MNASIIKLNYEEQEKRSFSKKLINKFTLKNNSYSPYLVLLKVFFAIFLALLFDTYITKNPDSVSSAFTAILCISTTVTRGIKACVSTFLMCCIGAIVSSLGNIIFGVDTTFLLYIINITIVYKKRNLINSLFKYLNLLY
ncbi:hypothetical protein BCR36DRAFT_366822 [Piromyces finnis]|uniref:Uncharacterized protein n=1 Tax=Piromyces finnis TaxID=1754191 RepID=A0A1Y1VKJ8_9FUNG|nr:hypothetical protein BCR36DRAFT_366822 [Piromyces finnis]|eukprot:ORX58603.1 hypothetical protein BCR36DRAFT_366822 [Piromyces finnis]